MNAFCIVALIAAVVAATVYYAPRCAPGDHSGPTIGGVMKLYGC